MKIAIIVAQFNQEITHGLLHSAEEELQKKSLAYDIFHVPGAFEIPLMAKKLAKTQLYDAILCFGAIIEGDTDHYLHVCTACRDGIVQVMMEFEIPLIFEVLMTKNYNDALQRIHKGKVAVETALDFLDIYKKPLS